VWRVPHRGIGAAGRSARARKATFTDTAVGLVCILLALLIWTYFTMWTIVTVR